MSTSGSAGSAFFSGDLRQVPLREVLQQDAADGIAILAGTTPVMQFHQFAEDFSIFWPLEPGNLLPGTLLDTFWAILAQGERGLAPISYVGAEAVVPDGSDRWRAIADGESVAGGAISPLDRIDSLVNGLWTTSISFFLSASSETVTDGIALWTDTLQTPANRLETGITARYGISTLVPLVGLMQATLPEGFAFVRDQLSSIVAEQFAALVSSPPTV